MFPWEGGRLALHEGRMPSLPGVSGSTCMLIEFLDKELIVLIESVSELFALL